LSLRAYLNEGNCGVKKLVRVCHPLFPIGILEASLFRNASEIEISVQSVFIGPCGVHEGDRNSLRKFPETGSRRGLVAHEDAKENRRRARGIFSERVPDADNLGTEQILDISNRGIQSALMNKCGGYEWH
jgi:hypothetical protein